MASQIDHIEEMLVNLTRQREKRAREPKEVTEVINGVDVSRIRTKDEYSYGLKLMDILFTKTELSESLLFESKKSEKKALDKDRVSLLFNIMDKRYGKHNWDINTFKFKFLRYW